MVFADHGFLPQEWQDHFCSLLPLMHGYGNYERVPDRVRGDLGMEAYSTDGKLYQCYADQGSNSTDDRYKKQCKKINDDLNTFCAKHSQIQEVLGDQVIDTWCLVVPRKDDKRLITYCNKKSKEVRAKNLPYASKTFKVVVIEKADLAIWEKRAQRVDYIYVDIPEPDIDAIMAELQNAGLETLRGKVARAYQHADQEERDRRVRNFVLNSALSHNCLTELSEREPQTYRAIASRITATLRRLESYGALPKPTSLEVLGEELAQLESQLHSDAPILDPNSRQIIVIGAIADWLLQCPLDFANAAA